MTSMRPRVFQSADLVQPAVIFTDGAWEDGKASGGGVVFFPELKEGFVFEIQVPRRLVDLWLQEVGDQLIGQIEMIAFVAVRAHFAKALTNRLVVAWLDNEAARFACIKGTSGSFSLQVLARVLHSQTRATCHQDTVWQMPRAPWAIKQLRVRWKSQSRCSKQFFRFTQLCTPLSKCRSLKGPRHQALEFITVSSAPAVRETVRFMSMGHQTK